VRAASEALGMQSIMRDMGWDAKIRLLVDSSAAKSIASRTGLGKLRHLGIQFLWLQEAVRRKKVVLSKVRGDINPADVLTKPKSLDDMKQLLNFSCIDWCDGELANSTCNNFEFVNSVGRSSFVDNRMWHPRGGVGKRMLYSGPQRQFPKHAFCIRHGPMHRRPIGSSKECCRCCQEQTRECVFGSSHIIK